MRDAEVAYAIHPIVRKYLLSVKDTTKALIACGVPRVRIPEPGKPLMEVSWAGEGSFRGTTNVSDFGTVWVELGT